MQLQLSSIAQCLKITQKVAFDIASEASYVYNLIEKSSLKMPKMVNLACFDKLKLPF